VIVTLGIGWLVWSLIVWANGQTVVIDDPNGVYKAAA
jgi:hypothetical protein